MKYNLVSWTQSGLQIQETPKGSENCSAWCTICQVSSGSWCLYGRLLCCTTSLSTGICLARFGINQPFFTLGWDDVLCMWLSLFESQRKGLTNIPFKFRLSCEMSIMCSKTTTTYGWINFEAILCHCGIKIHSDRAISYMFVNLLRKSPCPYPSRCTEVFCKSIWDPKLFTRILANQPCMERRNSRNVRTLLVRSKIWKKKLDMADTSATWLPN